jgi:hypothetical protein
MSFRQQADCLGLEQLIDDQWIAFYRQGCETDIEQAGLDGTHDCL